MVVRRGKRFFILQHGSQKILGKHDGYDTKGEAEEALRKMMAAKHARG